MLRSWSLFRRYRLSLACFEHVVYDIIFLAGSQNLLAAVHRPAGIERLTLLVRAAVLVLKLTDGSESNVGFGLWFIFADFRVLRLGMPGPRMILRSGVVALVLLAGYHLLRRPRRIFNSNVVGDASCRRGRGRRGQSIEGR